MISESNLNSINQAITFESLGFFSNAKLIWHRFIILYKKTCLRIVKIFKYEFTAIEQYFQFINKLRLFVACTMLCNVVLTF